MDAREQWVLKARKRGLCMIPWSFIHNFCHGLWAHDMSFDFFVDNCTRQHLDFGNIKFSTT